MTEAKTNLWAKAWRRTWIDDASIELDLCAIALRQYLAQHVGRVDDDGTGWATTESGAPVTPARMAIVLKTPLAAVHHSLDLLRVARIAVECGGEWGTVGWQKTQESTEAAQVRKHRAGQAVTAGVTVTGDVTPIGGKGAPLGVTSAGRRAEEQKSRRAEEQKPRGEEEQTPAAAAVIATRPSADPATMPSARARAVRPHQELPTSGGPVLAHALATELAALYRPEGRCFGPANPRHLELAAEVLAVAPSEGDDRRQLEQARFHEVLAFCRDFARICQDDPKQAEFWRPTMLSTRPCQGNILAAWDMLTRSVSAWRDRRAADKIAADAEVARQRRAREEAARPVERADPTLLADLTAGLLSRLNRPENKPAEPVALPPTTPDTFAEIRRQLQENQ